MKIVVSEVEVKVALTHLKALPFSKLEKYPESWSRKCLLNNISKVIGSKPEINKAYKIAPGLYALIQHFGTDLAGVLSDNPLQVWLLIRPITDPNNLLILNCE